MKRVTELNNEMKSYGDNMPEEYLVSKVLSSLTTKYDPYIGVIEQTKDLQTLTLQELLNALQMQENRLEDREDHNSEGAFYAKFKKPIQINQGTNQTCDDSDHKPRKQRWCSYYRKDNHNEDVCYYKNKRPSYSDQNRQQKSQIECFNCGEIGHIAKNCKVKKNQHAYMNQEEATIQELSFAASHTPTNSNTWIVDSGATSHMVKEENFFTELDKSIQTPIKVASDDILVSAGRGSIIVKTEVGQRTITNVLLVPKIDRNLLSVGQLVRSGYKVLFDEDKGIIMGLLSKIEI